MGVDALEIRSEVWIVWQNRIPVLVWQLKNEITKGLMRTIIYPSKPGNSCLSFIVSMRKGTGISWCE